MDFEDTIECILSKFPLDIDKSKGSVLYDWFAPKAISLAYSNGELTPEEIVIGEQEFRFACQLARMKSYY